MPSFGLAHSRPWRSSRHACITASGTGAHKTTFTYDNAGNRATKRVGTGAGNLTDYVYNAANQMIQVVDGSQSGPVEYAYDDDGNQVTVSVADDPTTIATTYAWDYENRLIGALTGASQSTFTYDPDGRRVKSDNGAAVTRYVWDEENILREEDGSGTLQQLNTLEPLAYGNLISRRSASSSQYYHYDGLGSTNQVTDQAEAITYSYLYKAFGEPLVATGLAAPQIFRYIGQLGYAFDNAIALGAPLYQVRARWYNPALGRWVSNEPMLLIRPNTQFLYVSNRLLAYVDPSGLAKIKCSCKCGPCHEEIFQPCVRSEIIECTGSGDACCASHCRSMYCRDIGWQLYLDPRHTPGIKLCRRRVLPGTECAGVINACGGAHTYIQFGPVGDDGAALPETSGVGFSGGCAGCTPSKEMAFNPTVCCDLRPNGGILLYGTGAGKPSTSATEDEIIDCIRNALTAQNYHWFNYNCNAWANEAAAKCGLDSCSLI